MNQLWRNQLLGLALEDKGDYKEVHFSVVRHPRNSDLDETILKYKRLIGNNPKFSVYTSSDFVEAASLVSDNGLKNWVEWYRELYNV